MSYRYGIQILSYNRPSYLKQTLESLTKYLKNDKIIVIEQSDNPELKEEAINLIKNNFSNIRILQPFKNLGQRGATNLTYSMNFWDDCDYVFLSDHDNIFHEDIEIYANLLKSNGNIFIASGLNTPEHDIENKLNDNWLLKSTARAGHMVLRKDQFYNLCPINEKAGSSSWFCGLNIY